MLKKFKQSPYCKASLLILICGAILIAFAEWIRNTHFSVGFETLGKTLIPIFIGVLCAFLVCPIYNKCVGWIYAKLLGRSEGQEVGAKDRRRNLTVARIVATLVCLILVVGSISALLYVIVPQIVTSCITLADTMPDRLVELSKWLTATFPKFPQLAASVDKFSQMGAKEVITWIETQFLTENTATIGAVVSSGVVTAVSSVVNTFIGILIMVYLLNYKETLFAMTRKFVKAICSEKREKSLNEFIGIFNETFINYIVGRVIDSVIIGIITYIALVIFKIPYAVMIAMVVGVTNVIPVFGPFIGAIPSFLIILLESPMAALEFLIIILIIQQFDGNVLGPIIVGDALGLGSFWVMMAVIIGGGLFGFMGMFFGVPVFAVIYRYVNKMTTSNLIKKGVNTKTSDYFNMDKFGIDARDVHLEVYKTRDKSISDKIKAFKGEKEDR